MKGTEERPPRAQKPTAPVPLRVCLLLESYAPRVGGTPTQARLLAEDLAIAGSLVTIVTRRWDRSHPASEQRDGARIVRVGPTGVGQFKKWGMVATSIAALIRLRSEYDLIYVMGLRILGMSAVLVRLLLGKRCVLCSVSRGELSGEFFASGLSRFRLGFLSRPVSCLVGVRNRFLRKADAFVAISSAIADELEACGVPPEKRHRIPVGVDTSVYRPADDGGRAGARRAVGLPDHGAVLLYTGRLVRAKGLPELLQAWRDLCAVVPTGHLALVGAGGNDIGNCEAELREYAAREGIADRVTFAGDVHDVLPYLRASEIFAFPTHDEALGISLIEAMACGLACVTTNVGGVRDIAVAEENALVVPVEAPPALKDAILRLFRDTPLRRKLGSAGVVTARTRFHRQNTAEKTLEILRSAL